MYFTKHTCRACGYGPFEGAQGTKTGSGNQNLIPVFDLGLQPLANDFAAMTEDHAGYAPLKVMFCPRCTLAQLSVVVRPEILYSHYLYVTSPSETMKAHFSQLTDALRAEQPFLHALEIGSNDGAYLQYLSQSGTGGCGIDPADNLAELAKHNGIATVTGAFTRETAEQAVTMNCGPFDLIVARHVFCHVNDWQSFTDNLAIPSHRDTLVAIEVPYCKDMLKNGEFDTIYHEHTSYLTIKAMEALLADAPFKLHRVLRFPIHGGAIVLLLRRKDWPGERHHSVDQLLASEDITLADWTEFERRSRANIDSLRCFVRDANDCGKRVAALGASAKSTVWVNACGFTRKEIKFIADATPQKQWKLSPGSDIPIVDEGAILRDLPDYLIVFAWNFLEEITAKNQRYLELGGKLVVPVPKLEVIEAAKKTEKSTCAV